VAWETPRPLAELGERCTVQRHVVVASNNTSSLASNVQIFKSGLALADGNQSLRDTEERAEEQFNTTATLLTLNLTHQRPPEAT
jgi:hypothetical protein